MLFKNGCWLKSNCKKLSRSFCHVSLCPLDGWCSRRAGRPGQWRHIATGLLSLYTFWKVSPSSSFLSYCIYKIAGAQQKKSGVASSCRGSVECGRPAAAAALSSEWQKEKEKHIQNFEIEEEESKLFKEILFFFYFVFLLTPETIVCASIRKWIWGSATVKVWTTWEHGLSL